MAVSADERRQLNLLKVSLVMAAPADPKESEELTRIAANLNATYGKGKWCPNPEQRETCLNIDDIPRSWPRRATRSGCARSGRGWHTIAPPMRNETLGSSSCRTKARASSGSPTRAPCGGPWMTCRQTTSRRSSTACGARCVRYSSHFTRSSV